MAIPDYQSVMLPLVRLCGTKNSEISTGEAVDALTMELGLSEDDLKEMLPSGVQPTFRNRVGWAATYSSKIQAQLWIQKTVVEIFNKWIINSPNTPKT